MKKILLINVSANSGSTGRIAEEIGQTAISKGYESYFAYGRAQTPSQSNLIKIGNDLDFKLHVIESRLFDNHGFASRSATKKLVEDIEKINPDIINIHNLHGYYLNIEILFKYFQQKRIPIVWTFHDCWPFTGHCSHFMRVKCDNWKTECHSCPNRAGYPRSLFLDCSTYNFKKKKELFTSINKLTIVTPSQWLVDDVKRSFLEGYPVEVICNGTNIEVFRPHDVSNLAKKYGVEDKKILLGVAGVWTKWKGFDDFIFLASKLSDDCRIILVGLNDKQIAALPNNIIGIKRTENVQQLAELYSLADVFVNPTYADNFPTTNIEALACGTPVVTYQTGGSPEAIDEKTGIVVEQGNVQLLQSACEFLATNKAKYTEACRRRAEKYFNKQDRFNDYVALFDKLIEK